MENYLPVTWKRALIFWWAVTWRTLLLIAPLLAIAIPIIAIVEGVPLHLGMHINVVTPFGKILLFLILIIILLLHLWVYKIILAKKFREFKIVLVSSDQLEILPCTWKRVLRIWWAGFWRFILYNILFYIVIMLIFLLIWVITKVQINIQGFLGEVLNMVTTSLIGVWIIKTILGKKYSKFMIKLVPNI